MHLILLFTSQAMSGCELTLMVACTRLARNEIAGWLCSGVQEVAKLRAEVAELAPGLRPFPRMSPPVLAIERGDSRGDGGLLREDCSFASKPSNESNLEPEQTFEPSEGKPDTLEGIPEHTEGKPTILVSSAAGLAQRLKKSLSADQNEDDWGTADVSVSVSNPAVEEGGKSVHSHHA